MTTVQVAPTQEAIVRVRRLVARLKARFWKNERLIEMMAACAVAGEPLLLLGDPGTGKTAMAKMFFEELGLAKGVENGYFEKPLHPFTDPGEVFGPMNFGRLTGRETGVSEFVRDCRGYLPTARAAFLDEIFAASPEFLLTLLAILEERVFHNGNQIVQSPLTIAFAASNDLPMDDRLRALRDRLPIRVVADTPATVAERADLLYKSHTRWTRAQRGAAQNGTPVCTLEDIAECRRAIIEEKTPEDFVGGYLQQYLRAVDHLARNPLELATISPRVQQKVYQVMRALALLRSGDPEPETRELLVLQHVFKSTDRVVMNTLHDQLKPFGDWTPLPVPAE